MQARAIFEAAVKVAKEGVKVQARDHDSADRLGLKEMANQAAIVRRVAEEVFAEKECKVEYLVGTMIELPRAALMADEIAEGSRVLQLRHQRSHADHLRLLARRRRQDS